MDNEVNQFLRARLNDDYYDKFMYSHDSGRRIRPLMIQKICERFGKDFGSMSKAAAAIEILHCASLMHDDIIDNDETRRGKAAFHKKFSLKEAVLYGDYFATLSSELIAEYYPKRVNQTFVKAIRQIIEGQIMEVNGINDVDTYIEYIKKKTGSLFYLSASIPMLVFKLDNKNILNFGREFGIAFQIANDLKKKVKEQFSILKFVSRKEAERLLTERVNYINSLNILPVESLGF
ncbi:MAG: polyprenyl synthetase family protein [Candidatus Aenigmatarchaeota archaeon]|nr:polyprenyl synthetase family protein [Nanoarchaeota archaeon]